MKSLQRLVSLALVSALIGIAAVGCNTVRGAGADIEHGGQALQRAADQARR